MKNRIKGHFMDYACDAMGLRLPEVVGVEFRLIDGLNGYAVGSDGSLWTCRNKGWPTPRHWRPMKPSPNTWGYLITMLKTAAGNKTVPVHRLVAIAFHGPRPLGMEVRHLDGNCKNNAAANLRYGTKSENAQDAMRHGKHPCLNVAGECNPRAKLNAETVAEIRRLAASGMNCGRILRSLQLPVDISTVQRIVNGSMWSIAAMLAKDVRQGVKQ